MLILPEKDETWVLNSDYEFCNKLVIYQFDILYNENIIVLFSYLIFTTYETFIPNPILH